MAAGVKGMCARQGAGTGGWSGRGAVEEDGGGDGVRSGSRMVYYSSSVLSDSATDVQPRMVCTGVVQ